MAATQRLSRQTGTAHPHMMPFAGQEPVQLTPAQLGASSLWTTAVPMPQHPFGAQSLSLKQVFPLEPGGMYVGES